MKRRVFRGALAGRRTLTTGQERDLTVLSGGRCAAGVVQRNFIERDGLNRAGIVPAGNFGCCGRHAYRSRKRRRMQRLANMANRVLSGAVMVQEAAARGEIEEREADEQGAIAAQTVLTRAAMLVAKRTFHGSYIQLPTIGLLKPVTGCFSATRAALRS